MMMMIYCNFNMNEAKLSASFLHALTPDITLSIVGTSADNLCRQFGPDQARILIIFLKDFSKKVKFLKKNQQTTKHAKLPSTQQLFSLLTVSYNLPFFSGVGTGINRLFHTPCNCGELFVDCITVLLGVALGLAVTLSWISC